MQILLGADPEVFVLRNGVPFGAHGMVPGTKKEPHKVKDGAIQVDGMALEFNIDPADTPDKFVHNTQSVLTTLEKRLPDGCKIHVVPSVRFDWDHMKAQPVEALEMGCDPDYNAYTGQQNTKPDGQTNLRTAAGHVHIGFTKDADITNPRHFESCRQLVKQLDYYLGLPSLILDKEGEERRQLYGKAGAFRPKPYGCEYRVLSNFWLATPDLMKWVYVTTIRAIEDLKAGKALYDKYEDLAETMINGSRPSFSKIANLHSLHPELWEIVNPMVGNKLRGV